jgi:TrpR family transcriptional regulator, trp operon repressor
MSDFAGYRDFLKICSQLRSVEEFKKFLDLFLSFEEKETLGKRYLIVKELQENKITQREIAKRHKVSIAQITRGSNALKIIDPKLKQFLKNHLK